MEADFNATNKTIYGFRMLANARKYQLMPEEVFRERNRLADDGTLSKIIIFDIARQLRRPMGLALVDADTCYDWIAHLMASMVFQAFGGTDRTKQVDVNNSARDAYLPPDRLWRLYGICWGQQGIVNHGCKKPRYVPRQRCITSSLDGCEHPNDLGT